MRIKLKDVFELQIGKTPSRNKREYWNGVYKWVSISDIGNSGKYLYSTRELITDKAIIDSGIKVIPKGTVIMSFKLSIGKTAITTEDMYTNEAIVAFIDKKKIPIDIDYLYYLCSGSNWMQGVNKAVMGLTLNKATLSEKEINIPNIKIQKKCAGNLDKIDRIIELKKQQLDQLDLLVRSLFIEMFGDPISNPKEWKKKKCKKILTKIGSGATPQGGSEIYKEEGISLIRSMNVHNGRFESKDLAYIDEKQAQKLDNVNIKENDVLINITGASVARCCIVPSDVIPARVNQHVSVLRCSDMVNSIFLCYQIINDSYQNLLKKIGTSGGATREAITKKQIEDLEVILPPLELQNKFANFVRGTDKSKLAVKKSLEELEILKKSLMQKYFA